MKTAIIGILFTFSAISFGGTFPSCPKGLVWNGETCISTCPEGYKWNREGKCVKAIEGATACKKDDKYFESVETGCLHLGKGVIFGQRSKVPLTAREAQHYCHRVEAGTDDWRLPNAGELGEASGSTFAGEHFAFPTNAWFWSSTYREERVGWGHHPHPSVDVFQKVVNLENGFDEYVFVKEMDAGFVTWVPVRAYVVCVRNLRDVAGFTWARQQGHFSN